MTRIESKWGLGGSPSCVCGITVNTGSLTWLCGVWDDPPDPWHGPRCRDVEAQSLAQDPLADAVNHRRPGDPSTTFSQRQAPKSHPSASLDSDAIAYQGLRAAAVTGVGVDWQEMGLYMDTKRALAGVLGHVSIYQLGKVPIRETLMALLKSMDS